MQVTIIILTYRRPGLLKRAISSALRQTYPDFQVHVYDNASGDETQEVVEEFLKKDSRLKYHCHPENIGMIANYEYALSRVETPYFSLLSDDDLLFPWFLEIAMQAMDEVPQAAFFAGSTLIMSEEGKVIRVPLDFWSREGIYLPPEGFLEMISQYPVPTCVLFQRKVIQEFPIDKENVLVWDCDFLLRIAARYVIVVNKRPCGIFLHHEGSYSKVQEFERWHDAFHRLTKKVHLMDSLSDLSKRTAIARMLKDLRLLHRGMILMSLLDRKCEQAVRYGELFKKAYGINFISLVLLSVSWVCRLFPWAVYLLVFLRKIKRARVKKRADAYEKYAEML